MSDDCAARPGYDLFHQGCRDNFRWAFKSSWRHVWWWKLVASDTFNRVCSKR